MLKVNTVHPICTGTRRSRPTISIQTQNREIQQSNASKVSKYSKLFITDFLGKHKTHFASSANFADCSGPGVAGADLWCPGWLWQGSLLLSAWEQQQLGWLDSLDSLDCRLGASLSLRVSWLALGLPWPHSAWLSPSITGRDPVTQNIRHGCFRRMRMETERVSFPKRPTFHKTN